MGCNSLYEKGSIVLQECNRWDARFFLLADMVASWSEDTSRRVGCILVSPSNEIIATGFNGLPRGIDASPPERHEREGGSKYLWFEHAERNAIYNAARTGVRTLGSQMYVNSFPCADCARAIVQSGISELRTYQFDENDSQFQKHFLVAREILREGGTKLFLFNRNDQAIAKQVNTFTETRDLENRFLR